MHGLANTLHSRKKGEVLSSSVHSSALCGRTCFHRGDFGISQIQGKRFGNGQLEFRRKRQNPGDLGRFWHCLRRLLPRHNGSRGESLCPFTDWMSCKLILEPWCAGLGERDNESSIGHLPVNATFLDQICIARLPNCSCSVQWSPGRFQQLTEKVHEPPEMWTRNDEQAPNVLQIWSDFCTNLVVQVWCASKEWKNSQTNKFFKWRGRRKGVQFATMIYRCSDRLLQKAFHWKTWFLVASNGVKLSLDHSGRMYSQWLLPQRLRKAPNVPSCCIDAALGLLWRWPNDVVILVFLQSDSHRQPHWLWLMKSMGGEQWNRHENCSHKAVYKQKPLTGLKYRIASVPHWQWNGRARLVEKWLISLECTRGVSHRFTA